jgi:hypothetical protein
VLEEDWMKGEAARDSDTRLEIAAWGETSYTAQLIYRRRYKLGTSDG